MAKQQMYFRDIDSTFCEDLQGLLDEAKYQELTSITLVKAIPDEGTTDMVWCSYNGEVGEKSECKKSICPYYESKSGRGKCKHKGQLYLHGEEETFIIN